MQIKRHIAAEKYVAVDARHYQQHDMRKMRYMCHPGDEDKAAGSLYLIEEAVKDIIPESQALRRLQGFGTGRMQHGVGEEHASTAIKWMSLNRVTVPQE
jgi:hypothetical protein